MLRIAFPIAAIAAVWFFDPPTASRAPASAPAKHVIRVGYLPNLTHAQALIGLENGLFARTLGPDTAIEPFAFNAGPSVIEALLAGNLDIAYVGPGPAINVYVKSAGDALRIIAGSCGGGARLIVRKGSNIATVRDFRGKRMATPQLGNTQDIAARKWLASQGLLSGEDPVEILPIRNPDLFPVFSRGEVDAAWAPEPWATRLVQEGNGVQFLDERSLWPNGEFATTLVIASSKFLRESPQLVYSWLKAHVELTRWINGGSGLPSSETTRVRDTLNDILERHTGQKFPTRLLDEALKSLKFTHEPMSEAVSQMAKDAHNLGFLGKVEPEFSKLYDINLLNRVLSENGSGPVRFMRNQEEFAEP